MKKQFFGYDIKSVDDAFAVMNNQNRLLIQRNDMLKKEVQELKAKLEAMSGSTAGNVESTASDSSSDAVFSSHENNTASYPDSLAGMDSSVRETIDSPPDSISMEDRSENGGAEMLSDANAAEKVRFSSDTLHKSDSVDDLNAGDGTLDNGIGREGLTFSACKSLGSQVVLTDDNEFSRSVFEKEYELIRKEMADMQRSLDISEEKNAALNGENDSLKNRISELELLLENTRQTLKSTEFEMHKLEDYKKDMLHQLRSLSIKTSELYSSFDDSRLD
jgi:regulator of replication initiation timing